MMEIDSLLQLAHAYREKQQFQKAAPLYHQAAELKDSDAEAWLSYCYLMMAPNLKNEAKAFRLSQIGVEEGTH